MKDGVRATHESNIGGYTKFVAVIDLELLIKKVIEKFRMLVNDGI